MERKLSTGNAQEFRRKPTEEELVRLETAEAKDILALKLLYNRQEIIPMFAIVKEDVEIDLKNRQEIKESIEHRGQASPIGVRPVAVSEQKWEEIWESLDQNTKEGFPQYRNHNVVYEIHNGFHRHAIMEEVGSPTIEASVWYNMSDEEFDAERIKASLDHTVKFSRLADWVQDAFSRSPWANSGLRIDQIFSLAANDSSGKKMVSRFDLTVSDILKMKEWANQKAEEWESSVGALYQDLQIVVNLDPQLIKRIRTGGGGSRGKGVLSPARVRSLVKVFNLDTDPEFVMQNKLARTIIEHDLKAKDLDVIAPLALMFKDNQEILQMIVNDPRNAVAEYQDLFNEKKQEDEEIEHEEEVVPKRFNGSGGGVFMPGNGNRHNYDQKDNLDYLKRENDLLRGQIASSNGNTSELQLLEADGISQNERVVILSFFNERKTVREISKSLNTTENKVWSLINSVLVKFDNTNQLNKLKNYFNNSNQ